MPWSGAAGSKTFSRTDGTRTGTTTWTQASAASVDIVATDHDTHDQDIATALNQALMKDGGNTATSNIPMGGFKFTNLGDAAGQTQALTAKQAITGAATYVATVSGDSTAGTITLTTVWSVASYTAGMTLAFVAPFTNSGSVTVNVDGAGAKTITIAGVGLTGGELVSGKLSTIRYDGTYFQLDYVAPTAFAVGSIVAWPLATVPSGWLECDGSAVSRATYAALYAKISTTYGTGDGSTTFNLPDYRDYFLRGYSSTGTDAASRTDRGDGTTGASIGTKQAAATLPHAHDFTATTDEDGEHTHVYGPHPIRATISSAGSGAQAFENTGTADALTVAGGAHAHDVSGTTDLSAGTNTETRPKNITVKWIILASPSAGLASFSFDDLASTTDTAKGTALVGYLRTGTGAVGRTLSNKLIEVVSIKDFGAVGDGVTDDSAAIQAAITAAAGRWVYAPAGQYLMLSGVSYSGPINLYGDGNGCGPGPAAISNSNCTQFLVGFASGNVFTSTSNYPSTFRDFQINTRVAQRPRSSGTGILIQGPSGSPGTTNANSRIINVGMTNQYDCVRLIRPAYPTVSGCYFDSFVRAGVYISTTSGCEGSGGWITGNYIYGTSGSTSQQACVILSCGYVRVADNLLLGANYGVQVYIEAHAAGAIRIEDNFIENQGSNGIIMATGDGSATAMVSIARNEFSNVAYTTSFVASVLINDYGAGTDWLTDVAIRGNVHRHTLTANRYIWVQSGAGIHIADEQLENLGAGGTTIGIDLSTSATAALKAPIRYERSQFVGTFGGGKLLAASAVEIDDRSSPTGGIGYVTGAGGTVTQATNKSTGVTLNKATGAITMNNASLASNTTVGFTLTNSVIAATDVVLVSIKSGATANSYTVTVGAVGSGSCVIELRNTTGGSLGEAVVLNFAVIKGVTS